MICLTLWFLLIADNILAARQSWISIIWASTTWENLSSEVCEQQRHRSACAPAQSDQCLCCWLISSPEPKAPRWAISIPVTPASVVRRPSVRPSVNIFKHLLLWNHWANWTQISYGDSLGWGKESLFKWSWSHDQDGRHAHIW